MILLQEETRQVGQKGAQCPCTQNIHRTVKKTLNIVKKRRSRWATPFKEPRTGQTCRLALYFLYIILLCFGVIVKKNRGAKWCFSCKTPRFSETGRTKIIFYRDSPPPCAADPSRPPIRRPARRRRAQRHCWRARCGVRQPGSRVSPPPAAAGAVPPKKRP